MNKPLLPQLPSAQDRQRLARLTRIQLELENATLQEINQYLLERVRLQQIQINNMTENQRKSRAIDYRDSPLTPPLFRRSRRV